MNVELRYKPAFATLFVTLAPGDTLLAESDAMASMTGGVALKPRFFGGFVRALLRRVFGGESLFVNEFSLESGAASGSLVLTQPTPGDVQEISLNGTSLFLQPGAFIACTKGIEMKMGWAGFSSWFQGEGLFRLQVSGIGKVWMGAYGGIFTKQLDGEWIVDSGHLVAYEPTLSLSVELAAGLFSSMFSGEGFVTRVRGRGVVYLQSRNIEGLASWTNAHLY